MALNGTIGAGGGGPEDGGGGGPGGLGLLTALILGVFALPFSPGGGGRVDVLEFMLSSGAFVVRGGDGGVAPDGGGGDGAAAGGEGASFSEVAGAGGSASTIQ